jgi:formate C-acetyltransferase
MIISQADISSKTIPGIENTVYEYGNGGFPRVQRVRKNLMAVDPTICPERALLITESYQQTEGAPYILRKAKALKNILANMNIYIEDDYGEDKTKTARHSILLEGENPPGGSVCQHV